MKIVELEDVVGVVFFVVAVGAVDFLVVVVVGGKVVIALPPLKRPLI